MGSGQNDIVKHEKMPEIPLKMSELKVAKT